MFSFTFDEVYISVFANT